LDRKSKQYKDLGEKMTTLPAQRQPRSIMPDLAELFGGSPLFGTFRPLFDRNLMRLEEEVNDGH
jgi:HSP20 family protein